MSHIGFCASDSVERCTAPIRWSSWERPVPLVPLGHSFAARCRLLHQEQDCPVSRSTLQRNDCFGCARVLTQPSLLPRSIGGLGKAHLIR
jgi:hypothetical protein